jgi:hypothetical protein
MVRSTLHPLSLPRTVVAALCLLPLLATSGSAAPTRDEALNAEQGEQAAAALQDEFADAPFGVDPTVTGPVTTAFRERQKQAGCDSAEWPNIPRICYPD